MQPRASRNRDVFDALRRDILSGALEPGARLAFAALVERYRSSVGVIREALQRLSEQGLVESETNRGFKVTSVSPEDLVELTEARVAVETLALRLAIRDGDTEWEAQLVAAHHRLASQVQFQADSTRFTEGWARAHADFHASLLAGCTNRRILAFASSLRDAAELYWRWSAPWYDRDRDIACEHKELLEASLARDCERVASLLAAHIERTTSRLLAGVAAAGSGSAPETVA